MGNWLIIRFHTGEIVETFQGDDVFTMVLTGSTKASGEYKFYSSGKSNS
jgi:hypothetical protein